MRGLAANFLWANQSRQSLTLNVKSERGRKLRLPYWADVFVHYIAPGTLERLGLSIESLHARNSRLISAMISGYAVLTADPDPMGVRASRRLSPCTASKCRA